MSFWPTPAFWVVIGHDTEGSKIVVRNVRMVQMVTQEVAFWFPHTFPTVACLTHNTTVFSKMACSLKSMVVCSLVQVPRPCVVYALQWIKCSLRLCPETRISTCDAAPGLVPSLRISFHGHHFRMASYLVSGFFHLFSGPPLTIHFFWRRGGGVSDGVYFAKSLYGLST